MTEHLSNELYVYYSQVPLYAHVKETLDQRGRRDSIEITYMKFFAYNGSYRVRLQHSC